MATTALKISFRNENGHTVTIDTEATRHVRMTGTGVPLQHVELTLAMKGEHIAVDGKLTLMEARELIGALEVAVSSARK